MPSKKGKSNSWASLLIVVLLLVALFIVRTCKNGNGRSIDENLPTTPKTTTRNNRTTTTDKSAESRGLNRNPSIINYSKHARCRMGCRHITEGEVKEILKQGKVNYSKSDLKGAECKKRYAVEGTTSDAQRVRIIFAPCQTEVTVVTVIDIGKEWPCDCQ